MVELGDLNLDHFLHFCTNWPLTPDLTGIGRPGLNVSCSIHWGRCTRNVSFVSVDAWRRWGTSMPFLLNFALIDLWPMTRPESGKISWIKVIVRIEDYVPTKFYSYRFSHWAASGTSILADFRSFSDTPPNWRGRNGKNIRDTKKWLEYLWNRMSSRCSMQNLRSLAQKMWKLDRQKF